LFFYERKLISPHAEAALPPIISGIAFFIRLFFLGAGG